MEEVKENRLETVFSKENIDLACKKELFPETQDSEKFPQYMQHGLKTDRNGQNSEYDASPLNQVQLSNTTPRLLSSSIKRMSGVSNFRGSGIFH